MTTTASSNPNRRGGGSLAALGAEGAIMATDGTAAVQFRQRCITTPAARTGAQCELRRESSCAEFLRPVVTETSSQREGYLLAAAAEFQADPRVREELQVRSRRGRRQHAPWRLRSWNDGTQGSSIVRALRTTRHRHARAAEHKLGSRSKTQRLLRANKRSRMRLSSAIHAPTQASYSLRGRDCPTLRGSLAGPCLSRDARDVAHRLGSVVRTHSPSRNSARGETLRQDSGASVVGMTSSESTPPQSGRARHAPTAKQRTNAVHTVLTRRRTELREVSHRRHPNRGTRTQQRRDLR